MKKFGLFTCLFLLSINLVFGDNTKFLDYTNYINDYTSTLSQNTINELNSLLADFDKQTSNQIAVAIIDALNNMPIEQYSIELARHWGIGQKNKNNGVLLLVAKKDKQLRIEVGYGLEGFLTDLQSKWIIDNVIVPRFKEGKFDDGIKEGVQKIINVINKSETIPIDKDADEFKDPIPFVLFIFLWILLFLFKKNIPMITGPIIGGFMFGIYFFDILDLFFGLILGFIFDVISTIKISDLQKINKYRGGIISSGGFGSGRSTSFGGGSFGGGGSSGRW